MDFIEITAVPIGKEPEWVREAWVGVELPIVLGDNMFIFQGLGDSEDPPFIAVSLYTAVANLVKHGRSEAADWWLTNIFRAEKFGSASEMKSLLICFGRNCIARL